MSQIQLGIKVDIDTDRGTRIGVPNLLSLFDQEEIKATFLFSLGPDNTGRAIKRIFRPGFLKKVSRTSVLQVYGLRTLLNGVLLPGPHIGKRRAPIMRQVKQAGHEIGIHCYDHIKWQDGLATMSLPTVRDELNKAQAVFYHVFGQKAKTAGAAGWQADEKSLQAYDDAGFTYASDCRGISPFYPVVRGRRFSTLQLPTTLPTLDELWGRPEYPEESLIPYYQKLLRPGQLNVLTIHAELEGMAFLNWFERFIQTLKREGICFAPLEDLASNCFKQGGVPSCQMNQGEIDGRSGTLALQGDIVTGL